MIKRLLFAAVLVFAAACNDPLSVDNTNSPDRDRVFTNPTDLETFVAGLFGVMLQATTGGSNDALQTQMAVMSLENTSGLANFAMGPRGTIPRNPITNQPGSQGSAGDYHDWFRNHRAARQAALAYSALNDLPLSTPAATARARLFARLVQGIALGNLSLAYDSASILTENDNPEADAAVVVALSHYSAVNAAALGYLDSAIALATANPAVFGSAWPVTTYLWFQGKAITQVEFLALARSYKARFRANVARSPAERAAVNWPLVIADANAGITANFEITMNASNGWDVSWLAQHFASAAWHQMPQFFLAMADTSNGYPTYLSRSNEVRTSFTIVTPDRRFPQGLDRTAQQASGPAAAGQPYLNTPYFRNRPTGNDLTGEPLSVSEYDFWRSRQLQQASRVGAWPILTAAEIRLLAAEGYFRTGDFPNMISRINTSRQAVGQLPAIGAITDTLTPVSVGASCVPKVPDIAQNYDAYKCGTVWDALKYEYRMETAYIGYGNWFFPGRGWGDLPEGTAVQWPVPFIEMGTRQQPYYGFGGTGGLSASGRGNYGLFAGGVY